MTYHGSRIPVYVYYVVYRRVMYLPNWVEQFRMYFVGKVTHFSCYQVTLPTNFEILKSFC